MIYGPILLIQNENQIFDWTAYLIMFGCGMIYNSEWSFLNVVLGFEFESQIVPFGAKYFIEGIIGFIVLCALALWDLQTKE